MFHAAAPSPLVDVVHVDETLQVEQIELPFRLSSLNRNEIVIKEIRGILEIEYIKKLHILWPFHH